MPFLRRVTAAVDHLPSARVVPLGLLAGLAVSAALGENAVLLALAATALHALKGSRTQDGVLIVGHGALGRLMARLATLRGGEPPVVWEKNPARRGGAAK